jgi:hypothetical protein
MGPASPEPPPDDDEPLTVASPPSLPELPVVASPPASEDPEPELEPLELEPPELDDVAASALCPSAPPESLAVPEPPLLLLQAPVIRGAMSATARSTAREGFSHFEPRLYPDMLILPLAKTMAPPR